MQPHADIGHLTNTQDPAWCVYCETAIAPPAPPWTWPGARAEVIVRAAEQARRRRQQRAA